MPDIPAVVIKDATWHHRQLIITRSAHMFFKDPVCGKRLQRGKAHIVIEVEGMNYFLCCPRCQTDFEHNLKLYAKPELGQKVKKLPLQYRRP